MCEAGIFESDVSGEGGLRLVTSSAGLKQVRRVAEDAAADVQEIVPGYLIFFDQWGEAGDFIAAELNEFPCLAVDCFFELGGAVEMSHFDGDFALSGFEEEVGQGDFGEGLFELGADFPGVLGIEAERDDDVFVLLGAAGDWVVPI